MRILQYVIPAGIAGIQKPRMAGSDHIHALLCLLHSWIPAVHAGMTRHLNKAIE